MPFLFARYRHIGSMMNWKRGWGHITKQWQLSTLKHHMITVNDQSRTLYIKTSFLSSYQPSGCPSKRDLLSLAKLPHYIMENALWGKSACNRCLHNAQNDSELSRDVFVRLWAADRKKPNTSRKGKRKVLGSEGTHEEIVTARTLFQSLERTFSDASSISGKSHKKVKLDLKQPPTSQPPTSQSVTGILKPISSEESKVAPLLARSNLLITRDIEWANLVLGFEQENRYAIVDVCYPQAPAGFIREQSNVIARQLLRLRRPFIAYITDGLGNELFRVRRPFWWITSSIYAEINGKEIGVVHRRWHLWKRIYDLYLGNKQFAVVENPGFWNWTFTLKDIDGNVLAEVDRDWRGFGFEIFTDAGQYVIRFGSAKSGAEPAPGVQELDVARSLTLSERAVAVALAVSLDNDYFSRHGGWGVPFVDIGE